jgi:hypothetical protein
MLIKKLLLLTEHLIQDYKTTSIPVALDWLIRHGYLSAEQEPDLPALVEQLHVPLHSLFS